MDGLDDLAAEIEDELTEEVAVRLVCRTCGKAWEYITVETIGFKIGTLVECPECGGRIVLTV